MLIRSLVPFRMILKPIMRFSKYNAFQKWYNLPVMSGHSKWAKIHRGKAVEDAKRGAVFTKLGNNIAVAARSGEDPEMNFALRLAIDKAKQANMPTNNIQRAIDRGTGKLGGEQIQEVMYEGYGPGGSAMIVECATDNVNRTLPEVRNAFNKHGGSIAEKGAVAFQFERKGVIQVKGVGEDLLLEVLDAGADDAEEDEGGITVYTDPKKLAEVRDNLKVKNIDIVEAELSFIPKNIVEISDQETAGKIERLMDALESLDDVSKTHVNFDINL
jgi:YebC/PmpR family DNA-binding regulatory protein